ncbi:MAG TPA: DinB family protein [Thermoanaerobaculia bacterium]|jgi:uncharacterized damage-inducible protein DinB
MSLSQSLLPEFDHEMANTRRVLERVPAEKFSWLPHDKSSSFGKLATHVANLPSLASLALHQDEVNVAERRANLPKADTTQELLDLFDKSAAEARASIAGSSDETLFQTFTLRNGDQVIFSVPKIGALRGFFMNHIIHHRGQLTVYLRLNGIPVPGLYGPSADES